MSDGVCDLEAKGASGIVGDAATADLELPELVSENESLSRPSARCTTSRPSARGGVWVDSDDEDSQGSRRSTATSAGTKIMSLLCIVWPAGMKKFPQCFYCKHFANAIVLHWYL